MHSAKCLGWISNHHRILMQSLTRERNLSQQGRICIVFLELILVIVVKKHKIFKAKSAFQEVVNRCTFRIQEI